jgi:hypothetical protein
MIIQQESQAYFGTLGTDIIQLTQHILNPHGTIHRGPILIL